MQQRWFSRMQMVKRGRLDKLVGSTVEVDRSFTSKDVQLFSELSGDTNPVHFEAACTPLFDQPIVHGMLCSSLFSMLLGSEIPGSIYVSQELKFKKPVYLDEQVCARIQVIKVRQAVNVLVCQTQVVKADQTIAIDGTAQVLLPKSA